MYRKVVCYQNKWVLWECTTFSVQFKKRSYLFDEIEVDEILFRIFHEDTLMMSERSRKNNYMICQQVSGLTSLANYIHVMLFYVLNYKYFS